MSLNNLLVSNVKRKLHSRSSSGSSSNSPDEKRLKDHAINATEDKVDESDEVFQELDMAEKLLERMDQISLKIQKLDAIEAKINKLDSIEEKMEKFATKLSEIENSLVSLRCEFNASKEKHADLEHSVDEVKESVDFAHSKVELLELKAYKTEANLKEAREELQKSILYLEAYSRRENLKFAGIPEGREGQEDTGKVLAEFLSTKLGIQNPDDIELQRVHRIGKKGDRPRMIIARFLRYADRERVMRKAFKLKNTNFTIYDDIPKELIELRKKHMPAFREARKAGKKAVFSKSEPDKLFIDGKLVV